MERSALETMVYKKANGARVRWTIISVILLAGMCFLFFFKYLEVLPINSVQDFIDNRNQWHPNGSISGGYLYNTGYTFKETTTKNGRETSAKDYTYFLYIDDNEDEYRMFLVALKGFPTQDYWEDFFFEGSLKGLDKTDRKVAAEITAEYELDDEIVLEGLFYEDSDPALLWQILFAIGALIFVVSAIYAAQKFVVCANPGGVKALRNPEAESHKYRMESALSGGSQIYRDINLILAGTGIFGLAKKGGWFLKPLSELIWVSTYVVTHRTNGVKTGTTYGAWFYFSDHSAYDVDFGRANTYLLQGAIFEHLPNVAVKYDKDWLKLWKKDFEELKVHLAERVKEQTAPVEEAEKEESEEFESSET